MKCPTCKGRPSERLSLVAEYEEYQDVRRYLSHCDDPIHDLADAAVVMLEALKDSVELLDSEVAALGLEAHSTNREAAQLARIRLPLWRDQSKRVHAAIAVAGEEVTP